MFLADMFSQLTVLIFMTYGTEDFRFYHISHTTYPCFVIPFFLYTFYCRPLIHPECRQKGEGIVVALSDFQSSQGKEIVGRNGVEAGPEGGRGANSRLLLGWFL